MIVSRARLSTALRWWERICLGDLDSMPVMLPILAVMRAPRSLFAGHVAHFGSDASL